MSRRRLSFLAVASLFLAVASLLAWTARAGAQELSDRATERCVRAAVRVQVSMPGRRGGTSTGSGSIVDPRGYVLTNFHVVGHVRWTTGGLPGSLFESGDRIQIATVESARESAQVRWLARVVRADVLLDLALLRIVARADGSPVPEGTTFPTVELATTEGMQPGAALWAFGFPLGVRTINVTGGRVTGFQMNARNQVAWVRTDAEFNPGNSGGMLVDRRGRLVAVPTAVVSGRETLEPIELARPVERIPPEWLEALARGPIDDTIITGIDALSPGAETAVAALGDAGGLDNEPEIHFFRLPPDRPATVRATPPVPLALVTERGVVRESRGHLVLTPYDPPSAMLAAILPRPVDETATAARLVVDVAAPRPSAPQVGEVSTGPVESRGSIRARGTVLDGRTGMPVPAVVFVARPGVDVATAAILFSGGQILPQQFESMLVSRAEAGPDGVFELTGLVPGRFATLVWAQGYPLTVIWLTIPPGASEIALPPLVLHR